MNKNFGKTAILFLIIIISSFMVSAVPAATWWGRVNISNVQYNDSAVIDAYINSVIVANVYAGEFTADYYHIDVECTEGDSVGFKIYGVQVAESNQTCSQGSRTELLLSITKLDNGVACSYSAACSGGYCCDGATEYNGDGTGTCQASACTAPSTTPPPTGGGAPSGAGAAPAAEECTELWECTAYAPCSDGKQTRTCTDRNSCGTTENKPDTERTCVVREEEEDGWVIDKKEAKPPTEEGTQVGQVQVHDNAKWAWTGTEWVKEGTAKYEEIVVKESLFGKLETIWLYVFIGVIAIAIVIVVIEIMRKKHRF